jgi:SAM-dependent MidA family methyltransferase
LISADIHAQGGAIPFEHFMQLALYAPGLGYYSGGLEKFGAAGDFVTAPELTPLFGRALARQVQQWLAQLEQPVVLEYGAGSGRLAIDLLTQLEAEQALPSRYLIMELSADLRQRQQQALGAALPHLMGMVEWLDRLPSEPLQGVILANEVLDAMPVRSLRFDTDAVCEQIVRCVDDQLLADWRPCAVPDGLSPPLVAGLDAGHVAEVNPQLAPWLATNAALLAKGALLLIDYGHVASDYWHAARRAGGLRCHYQQRAHDDALFWPGLQDITAHVDFTAVASAASAAGLDLYGFTTQAQFLMGCGIETLLQELPLESPEWFAQTAALRQLVLPTAMGEIFKVMALGKGLTEVRPVGFRLHDSRARL